jgi:hypothetical protein
VPIDEATALVVRQDRLYIVGSSYVAICRMPGADKPMKLDYFHEGDEGGVEDWMTRTSSADHQR